MDAFFPYQIARLAVGPIRVLYAKPSLIATAPTKIQDICAMKTPYTAVTNWIDFGGQVNPPSYSKSDTQNGLNLQNEAAPVDTEVTDVSRTLSLNIAEMTEHALAIIEQTSAAVETIAAAANTGAQKGLPFGSYDEVDRYRVAFIGKRRKSAGIVNETAGGLQRGRMFAVVLFSAAITGDAKTFTYDRGNFASGDVTFNAYPDANETPGKDHGRWLFEDAGTLT